MSRETITVQLPPSLGNAARKLAEEDGVSLNQWVSLAVAQKISSVETAEAFFKRRSQGAEQVDFPEILSAFVPKSEDPSLGTRVPGAWSRVHKSSVCTHPW